MVYTLIAAFLPERIDAVSCQAVCQSTVDLFEQMRVDYCCYVVVSLAIAIYCTPTLYF